MFGLNCQFGRVPPKVQYFTSYAPEARFTETIMATDNMEEYLHLLYPGIPVEPALYNYQQYHTLVVGDSDSQYTPTPGYNFVCDDSGYFGILRHPSVMGFKNRMGFDLLTYLSEQLDADLNNLFTLLQFPTSPPEGVYLPGNVIHLRWITLFKNPILKLSTRIGPVGRTMTWKRFAIGSAGSNSTWIREWYKQFYPVFSRE